jgi:hypothetical protein
MKQHILNIIDIWQNKGIADDGSKYKYFAPSTIHGFIGHLFNSLEELIASYNREYETNILLEDVERLLILL